MRSGASAAASIVAEIQVTATAIEVRLPRASAAHPARTDPNGMPRAVALPSRGSAVEG
ncbi:hypothetical protein [Actinokineospora spheciospongiae]|uniref:hypothetical protein n=1 Tax=Actinokineospora spheciospongiae TaxID=909613 RepID=UPI000D9C56AA|nr:hypothetical protein [Actinokineospora spheciospongiae]PWW60286.1 hypothetical protein DFQ13_10782 [Actinokineospora spheciospongiae]